MQPIGEPALTGAARRDAIVGAHTTARCVLLDRGGRIVHANGAARLALPERCATLEALLTRQEDLAPLRACLSRAEPHDAELPLRTRSGTVWHAIGIRPIDEGVDGPGEAVALLSAMDVDARRGAEARTWHRAHRDPRTGLASRAHLLGELERRLLADEPDERPSGLLVVDIDRFRRINDGLGYEIGDAVLGEVARRLTALAGPAAAVGRIGGDEFAVVTAAGDPPEALARRILEAMADPLDLAGERLHVSPSIGACRCPEHGNSVGDLLAHADVALATARRERSGYRLFDAEMGRAVHARLVLENDLALAIGSDQIEAHYQPRVSLATGRIVGFEALARWRHPERGLLPPAEFIPVAEETGAIVELGTRIMHRAMARQRAWSESGHDLTISINVSARQLVDHDLHATVSDALRATGCDPTRIELELTESALVGDADEVCETLRRIVELGVRFAIDDFGTGYSNLAYLKRYPLATLKIDRAFVADPAHAALLGAIVSMGHALGLELVAEGVECERQASWLAERGVAEAQGYLYGRALTEEAATASLGVGFGPGLPAAA